MDSAQVVPSIQSMMKIWIPVFVPNTITKTTMDIANSSNFLLLHVIKAVITWKNKDASLVLMAVNNA